MEKNKTLMIIALIAIFICGCPGCALLIPGINAFSDALDDLQPNTDVWDQVGDGFQQGGWLVLLSSALVMVPFVLVILALVLRKGKKVKPLEPTGVSKDDPIPPTT